MGCVVLSNIGFLFIGLMLLFFPLVPWFSNLMGFSFLLSIVCRWDWEKRQNGNGERGKLVWALASLSSVAVVGWGGGSVGVLGMRVQKCEECLQLGMESFCGLHFGVKEKAVGGVLKRCTGETLLWLWVPAMSIYLPKCHGNSILITWKHLKCVFSFHNSSLKN